MKGCWIAYSPEELAWVRDNARLPAPDLHAAFCEAFGRTDVCKRNLVALRKRNGWRASGDGRFVKGQISHNAGKKGLCAPGSEKGWFRKGERRGGAIRLYKPIGTERLSKEGYLQRKIHDGMPLQSRWRAVHLIEWEALHGPLPKGMVLKCLDGNRRNTAPANWEAVPRALLPRLAGCNGRGAPIQPYDAAPAELKPTVMALAKTKHAINSRARPAQ